MDIPGGGIPSAIILAQAALESAYLKRPVRDRKTGRNSYNIFGIKWSGEGPYIEAITHEYINGIRTPQVAKFRAYDSYDESLIDHMEFLLKYPRYIPCLRCGCKNPVEFARQLQKCGYATDPNYASMLIGTMRGMGLIK
jgi:flagellar protein FlgJ